MAEHSVEHLASAEEALTLLGSGQHFRALIVTIEDSRSFILSALALLPEAIVLCLLDDEAAAELPPVERLYCLPNSSNEGTISAVISLAFRAEERARKRDIDRFCSLGLGLKSIGRLGTLQDQLSLQLALAADTLNVDCAMLYTGNSAAELNLAHSTGAASEEKSYAKFAKEAAEKAKAVRHRSDDETYRLLALPLIVSGRLLGAVVLVKSLAKGAFGERDVAMGRTFCTSLALAIGQNNALVEQEKSWTQLVLRMCSLARHDKQASLAQLTSRIYRETNYSLRVMKKLLDLMVLKEENEGQRNNLAVLKGEIRSIRETLEEHLQDLPSQHDDLQELSFNKIVDDGLSLVKLTVDLSQVTIRRQYAAANLHLSCRESELQLLVVNLILRAIEELGGEGELELATTLKGETLSFAVSWWRSEARELDANKQMDKALGMGVVTSIVERYKGKLVVAPREKRNGRFEVTLPTSTVSEPQEKQAQRTKGKDGLKAGLRVLVVDDEKDILFYFRALLENRVQTVVTVSDIDEARAILLKESFDVMFLDSRMPGKDGITFYNDVLKKRYPELPVILFNGSEDPRDPYIADAGFYGILVKPCRGREIFSALEQILRDRRSGTVNQSFSSIS